MADIIPFKPKSDDEYPTFIKMVEGVAVECVDVDALSPRLRAKFIRERVVDGDESRIHD